MSQITPFEHMYFTYNFLRNHVAVLESDDPVRAAKKKAERRWTDRGLPVGTLLCLRHDELIRLLGEIRGRQPEYATRPAALFISRFPFLYYERDADKGKQAKLRGPRLLQYGVRREGSLFKVNHLENMI